VRCGADNTATDLTIATRLKDRDGRSHNIISGAVRENLDFACTHEEWANSPAFVRLASVFASSTLCLDSNFIDHGSSTISAPPPASTRGPDRYLISWRPRTLSLKYLSTDAKGRWWFGEKDGRTNIRWTYTFKARGAVTAALLTLFGRSQWAGYMKACLESTRRHFDETVRSRFDVSSST
jgi:hypothetical protein